VTLVTRWTSRFERALIPLALLTAGIHLYWGIPRFTNYAAVGVMPDPRPVLFVLSGHAILGALTLVLLGVVDKRWTYLPGMVLMLAHLVGYAAWHTVFSHGVARSAETTRHVHDVTHTDAVVSVVEHLVNSPLALASKLAEVLVFGLLLWVDLDRRRG
jgi:hypothetical protein